MILTIWITFVAILGSGFCICPDEAKKAMAQEKPVVKGLESIKEVLDDVAVDPKVPKEKLDHAVIDSKVAKEGLDHVAVDPEVVKEKLDDVVIDAEVAKEKLDDVVIDAEVAKEKLDNVAVDPKDAKDKVDNGLNKMFADKRKKLDDEITNLVKKRPKFMDFQEKPKKEGLDQVKVDTKDVKENHGPKSLFANKRKLIDEKRQKLEDEIRKVKDQAPKLE